MAGTSGFISPEGSHILSQIEVIPKEEDEWRTDCGGFPLPKDDPKENYDFRILVQVTRRDVAGVWVRWVQHHEPIAIDEQFGPGRTVRFIEGRAQYKITDNVGRTYEYSDILGYKLPNES